MTGESPGCVWLKTANSDTHLNVKYTHSSRTEESPEYIWLKTANCDTHLNIILYSLLQDRLEKTQDVSDWKPRTVQHIMDHTIQGTQLKVQLPQILQQTKLRWELKIRSKGSINISFHINEATTKTKSALNKQTGRLAQHSFYTIHYKLFSENAFYKQVSKYLYWCWQKKRMYK